jgi:hypothetical protein
MTMHPNEITEIILKTLESFIPPGGCPDARPFSPDTVLFGSGGLLDSTSLVSFVIDVEEAIRSASGVALALADERAMSQSRSPFGRVSSLADYAMRLLAEAGGGST